MSRRTKKFIYGVFYLAVLAVLGWMVYGANNAEAPSCIDGKRNQGEEQTDCGGPCMACEIKQLNPVSARGARFFGLQDGRVVLLGELVNPNEGYIAENVSYEFGIRDKTGYKVETLSGEETVFPLEKRYVLNAEARTRFNNIGSVELQISTSSLDASWEKFYGTLKPNVSLVSPPVFSEQGNNISISGEIKNQSSFSARNVKIIAILSDSFGDPVFAAAWAADNVSAFGSREFTIIIPRDGVFSRRMDNERAKFYVFSE
ncbi:hypothetical protein A3I34_02890 [Candidatus Jorgensenbacteria bacterium RIFCSPLOWO2_02_FULL_45_12]|uniref:Uncharacterized protein n=2 Tax=Candidatus Joergenseniibacteriota TaxID=1752739 RepID=A0A1F6BMY7_9BACT|nr:MAG: hypothetical protein UX22_C0008G0017 [Candidatus Jorgensenbacteria bacterium GW2011_GWA2_45_9]OGG38280.1 MAG: hypothetical protein A3D55_01455 [Candidatus Jorgensenbacteria bacterium RIFCSPHIGHO2_02_FULL_45_20]OGG42296.1 MAG: hypothetical protein A3I34_02890 [Candidatus Jorgensenbacteria bacterium RIFCSPLOWO2_02_FULL_45_12]